MAVLNGKEVDIMAYILTNGNYYITVTDTGKTTQTNYIDEAKLFATIG